MSSQVITGVRLTSAGILCAPCRILFAATALSIASAAALCAQDTALASGTKHHGSVERALRAAGLTADESLAVEKLLGEGKLPRFPGLAERVLLPSPPDEPFDAVVELAGLREDEAAALDRLLREVPFDSIEALLFGATPPLDALATQATVKLRVLFASQAWANEEIAALLQSGELSELEQRAIERLDAAIKQHDIANVLSIRQVFRPAPESEKGASWSALSKYREEDGTAYYMAMARAPIGGVFPVQFAGENKERFRVRLVSGDDDALTVVVASASAEDPASREFRLIRDRPVEFGVGEDLFALLYPSSYVPRSGPSTTELAQFIVTHGGQAESKETQSGGGDNQ
jgi:hypothetical protein